MSGKRIERQGRKTTTTTIVVVIYTYIKIIN
jgi:hypothetical protein